MAERFAFPTSNHEQQLTGWNPTISRSKLENARCFVAQSRSIPLSSIPLCLVITEVLSRRIDNRVNCPLLSTKETTFVTTCLLSSSIHNLCFICKNKKNNVYP